MPVTLTFPPLTNIADAVAVLDRISPSVPRYVTDPLVTVRSLDRVLGLAKSPTRKAPLLAADPIVTLPPLTVMFPEELVTPIWALLIVTLPPLTISPLVVLPVALVLSRSSTNAPSETVPLSTVMVEVPLPAPMVVDPTVTFPPDPDAPIVINPLGWPDPVCMPRLPVVVKVPPLTSIVPPLSTTFAEPMLTLPPFPTASVPEVTEVFPL
jgi:hypothetical protein